MTFGNSKILMYSWVMCEGLVSGTGAAEKFVLSQLRALGVQFLPNPSASAVSCVCRHGKSVQLPIA